MLVDIGRRHLSGKKRGCYIKNDTPGGTLIRKEGRSTRSRYYRKHIYLHFLYIFTVTVPNLFKTYLPKNPVAPNTVATTPLKDDLPPGPAFGK